MASGMLDKVLTGHTARVKSVALSPDGKTLVTVATDKTVRLWNARIEETVHRGFNDETVRFRPASADDHQSYV